MSKKRKVNLQEEWTEILEKLQERIGYSFKDCHLLLEAITHRSFLREEAKNNAFILQNERLEFLGDAVLSIVAAQSLYLGLPKADEGTLTQLRASYVCEAHLAQSAKNLDLGALLRASASVKRSGSIEQTSLLSDALEAIIGAVYLDGGFDQARDLTLRILGPVPNKIIETPKDPKTELQEFFQAKVAKAPTYKVLDSEGPAHAPSFVVQVSLGDKVLAAGRGPSKKEAAQVAAKLALVKINENKWKS